MECFVVDDGDYKFICENLQEVSNIIHIVYSGDLIEDLEVKISVRNFTKKEIEEINEMSEY